jgi:hypothetical protein
MNISNFEPSFKNETRQEDVASCEKCNSTWFEQLVVKQFKLNHTAIIGQLVPPAGPYEFVVLRCIKCGEKYQPNVMVTAQDRGAKLYNEFLDELEDAKKEQSSASEPEKKE